MKIIKSLFSDNLLSGNLCNHDLDDAEIGRTKATNIDNPLCLLFCIFIVFALPDRGSALPQNLTESNPAVATSPNVSIAGDDRWVVWIEYTYEGAGSESAAITAQHFNAFGSVEGPLTIASGRVMTPVVLTVNSQTAWFFWIELDNNSSQLRARRRQNATWAAPVTVSTTRAAYPSATLDQNENEVGVKS